MNYLVLLIACAAIAAEAQTGRAMVTPVDAGAVSVTPLWTVGQRFDRYLPPGVPDGIAAWQLDDRTIRLLVNHELPANQGRPYSLTNGVSLRGARISYFDLDTASLHIRAAGPAYDRVHDRDGRLVTEALQISGIPGAGTAGFDSFCSGAGYAAGEFGFADDIYFAPEEVSSAEGHPHGGSFWALDPRNRTIWALPSLGRGSWENLTAIETPDYREPDGHVALLLSDDIEFGAAPLYLWIGKKNPHGDFPDRNGLRDGTLHVWVAENGDVSPTDWHGTGTRRDGRFVPLAPHSADNAGLPGHDARGYPDDAQLRRFARGLGAFIFSRPEDLHTDPAQGTRAVFASTGQGLLFPEDDLGTLYLINIDWREGRPGKPVVAAADIEILHDADEFGDYGIRSADNLTWAHDGWIYVQEDMATKHHVFGADSGKEASIWRIRPDQPQRYERLAVIDRSVVLPADAKDARQGQVGAWETSGILDITALLPAAPGTSRLVASIQAHSVKDGSVGGAGHLVESGQLILLTIGDDAAR